MAGRRYCSVNPDAFSAASPQLLKRLLTTAVVLALCGCAAQSPPQGAGGPGETEATAGPGDSQHRKRSILARTPVDAAARDGLAADDIPAGQPDIWAAIDDNLAFAGDIPDHRVEPQLRRLAHNQAYFDRTLERAKLYLPYILDRVLDQGLPAEVALLPFVESAFNPFAESPSGAAGLWQFIPATGDHLRLERNLWYDGRRDVVASTEAAIIYLKRLHRKFDGDWLLALAAYNAGPGTVRRAVKENRRRRRPTDFWSLDLRRETTRYVPRLIALTKVIRDPVRHGVELKPIAPVSSFAVVETEGPVNLNQAAELAGISSDRIQKLNPGYSRWITPPNGPHRLFLPRDLATDFTEKLAASVEAGWRPLNAYRVARGDTLSTIAADNGLSARELAELNRIDSDDILSIGQVLAVPGEPGNRPASAKTAYAVKPGDSLWRIARANRVTVDNLLAWNGLARNTTLQVGQKLRLYGHQAGGGRIYRVKRGDSLYSIAQNHAVELEDLIAWNDLKPDAPIRPGQELKVRVF